MFGKVKVNTRALATIIGAKKNNGIYEIKSIEKDIIRIRGSYLDRGKKNNTLQLRVKKGLVYFEDFSGKLITYVTQGVEQDKVFEQLKEIYNII